MQQEPIVPGPLTLHELIWHDAFRAWVLYPTPESTAYWQAWAAQQAERTDTLAHAREVVLALRVKDRPITDADVQQVITVTRQHLDLADTAVVRPLRARRAWVAAAGVAVLLLAGSLYWWAGQPGLTHPFPPAGLVSSNTAAQTIRLADGSTVRLGAGSQLRYPRQFGTAQRAVYLTGTATFDVAHNPDQPFLVYANGSVTRVLGTRFTVQAPAGENRVTVKVLRGKVSVLPESEWRRAQQQRGYQPHTVLITPNQQVIFDPSREQMRKSIVAEPVLQQPTPTDQFLFTNAPVARVFGTLEQAYGIPIVFDADRLQHCVVTAPLADEPLLDKLDIICETIGARYDVVDAQIIVSGRGCAP